jgi:hypothetical protein
MSTIGLRPKGQKTRIQKKKKKKSMTHLVTFLEQLLLANTRPSLRSKTTCDTKDRHFSQTNRRYHPAFSNEQQRYVLDRYKVCVREVVLA